MRSRATKIIATCLAVLLVALVGAGLLIRARHGAPPAPIASSTVENGEVAPSSGGVHYLQNDPRWADDTIGGSGERLSAVGCTVCSIAMAATALGCEITPKELNARLVQADGYTRRGWLVWSKVADATDGRVAVRVPSRLRHADIDAALENGSFPVVKVRLASGIFHWMPIVGKSGTEYLVRDPLDSAMVPAKLSTRADAILSVRYVEKR